jgi:hypothetical protein
MKTITWSFFLFLVTFTSFAQQFETKIGGHEYTLEVPDYLKRTFDLNDVATLQCKNILKDVYLIVIEDDKKELESLEIDFPSTTDFLNYFVKDYNTEAEDRTQSEVVEFENNGNNFSQVELTFKDEAGEYFMLITAVQTKTHFYKIMNWTKLVEKDIYYADFKRTAKSLQD